MAARELLGSYSVNIYFLVWFSYHNHNLRESFSTSNLDYSPYENLELIWSLSTVLCYYRNVAGAPETNWPAGAYVTRRGCFKDFNSAHFVYRFLIRRILFSSSRSAEMLFWEIYFIYTLEGKEISKTLNIGQEFMKKIYFANTQPLLMTFTLLRLYHLC